MSNKEKLIDEILKEIKDETYFQKKTNEAEFCDDLCKKIISFDKENIRYVALCRLPGLKLGDCINTEKLILDEDEREKELVESCLRHLTSNSEKLGGVTYSSVVHGKITKLVIPITDLILVYMTVNEQFDYHPMLHDVIYFINKTILKLNKYSVPKWLTHGGMYTCPHCRKSFQISF